MAEQTKSSQTTEVQYDFVELLGSRALGSGGRTVAWPRSRLAAGRRRRVQNTAVWGSISPTGAPYMHMYMHMHMCVCACVVVVHVHVCLYARFILMH